MSESKQQKSFFEQYETTLTSNKPDEFTTAVRELINHIDLRLQGVKGLGH